MPDFSDHTLSYVSSEGSFDDSFVAPYLVLAIERTRPLAASVRLSLAEVEEVRIGRGGEREWERVSDQGRSVLRIAVPDSWMSSLHAVLAHRDGVWFARDADSKNGTFVNGEPLAERPLVDGDIVEAGSTLFLFRNTVVREYREPADVDAALLAKIHPGLATLSLPFFRELSGVQRLAASTVPLIVHGKTGTGKEVVARMVHDLSGRTGEFVAINCGAIPEALLEGELFGHKKGAFSGASNDQLGYVRAASGGTLLLDEVGELPDAAQTKLLRVLQESEVVPVGATTPVSVDLRVVAATHRDLAAMVEAGTFRRDLYARLAGAVVSLPPLRERREDIGTLIATLLPRVGGMNASFSRDAARALLVHDWPLNVRELEQTLRAAVALAGTEPIGVQHLPQDVESAPHRVARAWSDEDDEVRDELIGLLGRHRGNVSAVAREMGKARVQIRRWCKRFGLDSESFRR